MNTLIEKAIEKVLKETKLPKQQLEYNEDKARRLFDGKTIFESFRNEPQQI